MEDKGDDSKEPASLIGDYSIRLRLKIGLVDFDKSSLESILSITTFV